MAVLSRFAGRALEDLRILAVAGAGGLAFHTIGVPAGWLTGAMVFLALAGLIRPWRGPSLATSDAGMLLSGTMIGAAATPEALRIALHYPGSLVILMVSMAVTVLATGYVLVRFGKWSRLDALLASAPGALSAVTAIARDTSGNMARIAVIQLFRLFVLVGALPGLLVLAGLQGAAAPQVTAASSWPDVGTMLLAALVTGLVLRRLGIVAPMILGATLASMVLHGTDLVHGSLPPMLAVPAFVIVGSVIGTRLGGLDRAALSELLPLALLAFVVSCGISALFSWPASVIAGVSYGTAFVAFAPGGLEAMAMLAVILGLDPLYVGTHHLVRFVAVGLLLPLAAKALISRDKP